MRKDFRHGTASIAAHVVVSSKMSGSRLGVVGDGSVVDSSTGGEAGWRCTALSGVQALARKGVRTGGSEEYL